MTKTFDSKHQIISKISHFSCFISIKTDFLRLNTLFIRYEPSRKAKEIEKNHKAENKWLFFSVHAHNMFQKGL